VAHNRPTRLVWTPETARAEAQRLLGQVKKGEDPAAAKQARRQAANVSELCDFYLGDAEAGRLLTRRKKPKKRSTIEIDKGRIERHIKPLLGRLKVTAVTTDDIDNFMHDVAEGKTAGNTKSAKNADWLGYVVVKRLPPVPSAFSAGYSAMRSSIACAKTIQCAASSASRMGSESGVSPTTNIRHWATRY
jgi:hypothetical protein